MAASVHTYDRIGVGYAATRQPDPRIAARIDRALGDAASVANIGAGAGSYEPRGRPVVAVEPAETMVRQRPPGSAPAVRGRAEHLPLRDGSVDAALAVLTLHHWNDLARGLAEMRRVASRRVVLLTWDEAVFETFWLIREYLPTCAEDRRRTVPLARVVAELGGSTVLPVPVPHDCVDGFYGAYWRRPDAYLDPQVRAGISSFAVMPESQQDAGLRRLAADLESGAWHERHRRLATLDELDIGYRLVVAELG